MENSNITRNNKNMNDEHENLIILAIINRIHMLIQCLDSDELDLSTFFMTQDELTQWKSFLRKYDIPLPLELKIALLHH